MVRILSTFFIGVDVLERKSFHEIKSRFQTEYISTLMNSYQYWPVVQTVNFVLIPAVFRTVFVRFAALFWNAYLCWSLHNKKKSVIENPKLGFKTKTMYYVNTVDSFESKRGEFLWSDFKKQNNNDWIITFTCKKSNFCTPFHKFYSLLSNSMILNVTQYLFIKKRGMDTYRKVTIINKCFEHTLAKHFLRSCDQ